MNKQIDNALGGYEESVRTLGGGSNSQDSVPAQPAPDTLLEQIKELRPKVTQGEWRQSHRARQDGMYVTEVYSEDNQTICTLSWWYDKSIKGRQKTLRAENAQFIALAPDMADRIIEDAEERKQDALIIAKSAEREAALKAENERLRDALSKYQEAERWASDKGYQ